MGVITMSVISEAQNKHTFRVQIISLRFQTPQILLFLAQDESELVKPCLVVGFQAFTEGDESQA